MTVVAISKQGTNFKSTFPAITFHFRYKMAAILKIHHFLAKLIIFS